MSFPLVTMRCFFWAILVASAGALAFALISQYGFGYEPCLLCRYQRIPYWTVVALSAGALAVPGMDERGVAWVIATVFACGGGLAFYHVGVEENWWKAGACAAQVGFPSNFEAFRDQPFAPIAKSCDTIDWTLFGLSMATYNVAASLALAMAAAMVARRS